MQNLINNKSTTSLHSKVRLDSYKDLLLDKNSKDDLYKIYFLNQKLISNCYFYIANLEVPLRNKIDTYLKSIFSIKYKNKCWSEFLYNEIEIVKNKDFLIFKKSKDKLKEAIKKVDNAVSYNSKKGIKPYNDIERHNRIISNLSLGFWVIILDIFVTEEKKISKLFFDNASNNLIKSLLDRQFIKKYNITDYCYYYNTNNHKKGNENNKNNMQSRLKSFNYFRNRCFHHENILKKNIMKTMANIQGLINIISGADYLDSIKNISKNLNICYENTIIEIQPITKKNIIKKPI